MCITVSDTRVDRPGTTLVAGTLGGTLRLKEQYPSASSASLQLFAKPGFSQMIWSLLPSYAGTHDSVLRCSSKPSLWMTVHTDAGH